MRAERQDELKQKIKWTKNEREEKKGQTRKRRKRSKERN